MTKSKLVRAEIEVEHNKVGVMRIGETDYISLTDLARYSNQENPANVIIHWMSNKSTFDYLGLWEQLNNPAFNFTTFREIKTTEVGYPSFTLSPKRWIEATNAAGIYSRGGRYSIGTFAHPDIAFEFASWLSPEFKLYLIKEFERLKQNEAYQNRIEWNMRRSLSKTNYRIHTDSVKEYVVPKLKGTHSALAYASEADVINLALFGMTAKEWRDKNPTLDGNIRDHADILHLIVLSNLEVLNSKMIEDEIPREERLHKLNELAIRELTVLAKDKQIEKLEEHTRSLPKPR